MPFYEQLARHPQTRWLAYVIEAATPILVSLILAWTVLVSFQHADERARETRATQVQSCAAVKGSNDATLDFLRMRIRANPKVDTPEAESFLTDLGNAYAKQETKCLVKP